MKIIICKPGQPAKAVTAKDEPLTLQELQQIVEGHIEAVHADGMPKGTLIICNEEGKLLGLPQNREIQICGTPDMLCGTFLICAEKGEELVPLEEATAAKILAKMEGNAQTASTTAEAGEPEKRCCLCGQVYEGFGNNAWPLADGECCDSCNDGLVVPERFKRLDGARTDRASRQGPIFKKLEAIMGEICEHYCKYRDTIDDEDTLSNYCAECPLVTEL